MLRIRFLRIGRKNQPFFRLVVTDKKNPPQGGRFLEVLGFFNPLTKEKKLKKERIEHWLKNGAKPSARVHNLLVSEGIIKAKKIAVHSKAKKKEESAVPAESAKSVEPAKKAEPTKPETAKEPASEKEPALDSPNKESKI